MLSRGGSYEKREAKIEAGVFLLTHVDAVLHVINVKNSIIDMFLSACGNEMAPGFIPHKRAFPPIKDPRAAGREIVL